MFCGGGEGEFAIRINPEDLELDIGPTIEVALRGFRADIPIEMGYRVRKCVSNIIIAASHVRHRSRITSE